MRKNDTAFLQVISSQNLALLHVVVGLQANRALSATPSVCIYFVRSNGLLAYANTDIWRYHKQSGLKCQQTTY